ncbi:MAG: hypothetical protein ABIR15_20600 [Chitinophagaceae bacterium]
MKLSIISLIMLCLISSCNSQQTVKEKAIAEKNAIESARPGTIPAKEGGWTMTAKINGKAWMATSLMPPEAAGRIIGYYKNAYIGLPYYHKMGEKTNFGESNAVDLSIDGDDNFYGGRTGGMEIIKVNGDWVEGIFHFTANSKGSSKIFEVTDGFFRISMK